MLECIQVQKSYSGQNVLDIPSLQLKKGIYWLQGPNGCGKTTFLRVVAGLLPFKGEILLSGVSLHGYPVPYRRSVSWADAEPLYPAFLKGFDLIAFYQDIRGASPKQVEKLIEVFQARAYLSAPVGSYSSGMIKKLSLILAFIGYPSLIVLDEPLVTLDQESIPGLYALIREYHEQRAVSFVLSSHQDLEHSGAAQDLFSDPATNRQIARLLMAGSTIHLPA